MQKKFFIGIDVSKHTLDVAFIIHESSTVTKPLWSQFANSSSGLRAMHSWLTEQGVLFNAQAIIVIENTGIYHRLLWHFFSSMHVDLCIENAAQVKWSLGIARGKNDKVDSRRLALYALRHVDRLKPTPALHQQVLPLKDLMTLRNKLLLQINNLNTGIKELNSISISASFAKEAAKLVQPAISGLQKALKKTEQQIKALLKKDKTLLDMYKRLNSVPGIGHITAVYLICCSNMFTLCSNGKQLACYCGVVPFEHQSGISIRGRSHVHKMANKELKRLLHMCALTSIKNHPEFKDYYERKKLEGKHAMSILNAIKNKIILRAFAVIKNERNYVDNYKTEA